MLHSCKTNHTWKACCREWPLYQSAHNTSLEAPRFTDSNDMIRGPTCKNGSRDPDHAHYGVLCHHKANTWYILPVYKTWRLSLQPFRRYDCGHRNWKWVMWPWPHLLCRLVLHIVQLFAKFDDSNFNRFRDIVRAHENLNCSSHLTTPFSGMVCYPRASTCYGQPTYQIWSLCLHPLRRHESRCRLSKMGWFGVVRGHSRSLKIDNSIGHFLLAFINLAHFLI